MCNQYLLIEKNKEKLHLFDTCKHLVNNFNEFRPFESRASLSMNKNTCTIRSIKTYELKMVL